MSGGCSSTNSNSSSNIALSGEPYLEAKTGTGRTTEALMGWSEARGRRLCSHIASNRAASGNGNKGRKSDAAAIAAMEGGNMVAVAAVTSSVSTIRD